MKRVNRKQHTRKDHKGIIFPLISSFIIVNVLCFIDEGYYDFRWMKEPGAWIVFGIYFLIFFGIQYAIGLLLRKIPSNVWLFLVPIFGIPLGLWLAFQLFT